MQSHHENFAILSFIFRIAACCLHTTQPVGDNIRQPPKTVEERLGLPLRPKKPLTPYFRYLLSIRPEIAKSNPQMKAIDVVTLCAKKWLDVDEATKKKLNDEYQKEKIGYLQVRTDYDKKLTEEQKESIKLVRKGIVESRERRIYKKVSKSC